MQSRPKLVIPCASLKAGQTLTFQLQVFNANNRYQYSQAATTYVIVENRNLPQVCISLMNKTFYVYLLLLLSYFQINMRFLYKWKSFDNFVSIPKLRWEDTNTW